MTAEQVEATRGRPGQRGTAVGEGGCLACDVVGDDKPFKVRVKVKRWVAPWVPSVSPQASRCGGSRVLLPEVRLGLCEAILGAVRNGTFNRPR